MEKERFYGFKEKDLESAISIHKRMEIMYDVSEDEKLKDFPVMLTGDALFYYP